MTASTLAPRPADPAARGWRSAQERGSSLALATTAALARAAGRSATRAFLLPALAYFHATAGQARRASDAYFRRLLGRVPRGAFWRQLRAFADCTLDRMYFLRGELAPFAIVHHGHEHLRRLAAQRRGALLVGAHVGSFEAMRGMAGARDLPVWTAVDATVARRIDRALGALARGRRPRVLPIRAADPTCVLEIAARIEAGGLVAILADRVEPHEPAVEVPFLGAEARFPAGPWVLAAAVGCPVYLTFGLYAPPNRYRLFCEPFAERIVLPRRGREGALRAVAARYVRRLEHYLHLAPFNWFNFYDVWNSP